MMMKKSQQPRRICTKVVLAARGLLITLHDHASASSSGNSPFFALICRTLRPANPCPPERQIDRLLALYTGTGRDDAVNFNRVLDK
jgi:hypothetical protein